MELYKRHYLLLIFLSTVCLLFFYYSKTSITHRINVNNLSERLYLFSSKEGNRSRNVNSNNNNNNDNILDRTTHQCRLPIDLHPFHSSIAKYVKKYSSYVKCPKSKYESFKNFTFLTENGVLITKYATNASSDHPDIHCYYRSFERYEESDSKLLFSDEKPLPDTLDLNLLQLDFVAVKCLKDEEVIYKNTHCYPSTMDSFDLNDVFGTNDGINTQEMDSDQDTENVPVFILVIESLSRLNYLRSMNRTRRSFESLGDYIYMKGLTKLADNSFPNMVPFLTGLRTRNREFPKTVNETGGPYDELPFIWKQFQAKGYKTALIEDHPRYTLFNYLAKGFKSKPTDWYPRPYWLQMEREGSNRYKYCYNGVPKVELFFNQVSSFLKKMGSKPYFLYSFYIQVTHDDFNKAQFLDTHISKFINNHRSQLSRSIFILMGDHGNRYGNLLETDIGFIEERMPLFALHIPQIMVQKWPHLLTYLKYNERRLTTWLDVHTTLLDLVNSNFTAITTRKYHARSYSLWREQVPIDRTCKDALIPDEFCVCDERREMNVNDPRVKRAARVSVAKINALLSKQSKCRKLSLVKIKSAFLVLKSDVADFNGETRIEVVISVKPSNAVFRTLVIERDKQMTQSGDIQRINQYGMQSSCIQSKQLRKYCYCKSRYKN